MKLFRDAYSLWQGTRKYRKIKALQLYASIQQIKNGRTMKKQIQNTTNRLDEKTQILKENTSNTNDKTKGIKKTKGEHSKQLLRQQKIEKKQKASDNSSGSDDSSETSSIIGDQMLGLNNTIDIGNGGLLVFMADNKQTVVSGEFGFCVLHGELEINGFRVIGRDKLSDKQKLSMHSVSSLPKNSLLCFDTTKHQNDHANTNKTIKTGSELLQLLNHNAVLISNKSDCEKLIDQICSCFDRIQQYFTDGMTNLIYVQNSYASQGKSAATSQQNTQFTQHAIDTQPFIQWTQQQSLFIQKASNSFLNQSSSLHQQKESKSILLCGSKNCGKSIYALHSINKLLDSFERVCVLDTDLGQSLFHFPGTVSLFSVSKKDIEITNLSKVHFLKPAVSVFVGEFSPQKYIETYIAGIKKCFRFYEEYFINSPLVINTHGFITNIGELLLYEIMSIIQPSFIGLLSEDKEVLAHLQDIKLRDERLSLVSEQINYAQPQQAASQAHKSNCVVADLSEHAFRADALKVNEAKRHRKDELIFQYLTQTLKGQTSLQQTQSTPFATLFQSHYGQLCLQTPFQASIQALTFIDLDSNQQISMISAQNQRKCSFEGVRKVSFDVQRKLSLEGGLRKTSFDGQQLQKLQGTRKLSNFDDILLETSKMEDEELENNEYAENIAKHFNCAVVALFDSAFSIQNNPTANCIGFGFIRDVDIQNKTIELLTSQTVSFDLSRVTTIVKSSEIAFSKHFYLRNSSTVMEISELAYDLKADFTSKRTIDVPFLLPKACGLGNFSFRSRVSGRK